MSNNTELKYKIFIKEVPNINHRYHNLLNHNVTILTSVKCRFSNITFEPHNEAFTQDWEHYLNEDCARSWRTHFLGPMVSRYVNQLVEGGKANKDCGHEGDGEDMNPTVELNDNFSVIAIVGNSESMHFYVIFHEEPLLQVCPKHLLDDSGNTFKPGNVVIGGQYDQN